MTKRNESPVQPGDKWRIDEIGPIKVMAVADGYAMARRPRCIPFVISVKDLLAKHDAWLRSTTDEG